MIQDNEVPKHHKKRKNRYKLERRCLNPEIYVDREWIFELLYGKGEWIKEGSYPRKQDADRALLDLKRKDEGRVGRGINFKDNLKEKIELEYRIERI